MVKIVEVASGIPLKFLMTALQQGPLNSGPRPTIWSQARNYNVYMLLGSPMHLSSATVIPVWIRRPQGLPHWIQLAPRLQVSLGSALSQIFVANDQLWLGCMERRKSPWWTKAPYHTAQHVFLLLLTAPGSQMLRTCRKPWTPHIKAPCLRRSFLTGRGGHLTVHKLSSRR